MKRIVSTSAIALLSLLFFCGISSGDTVWTGKRLTIAGGASEAPAIAVDSKDNIYVVYQDDKSGNNEIYYNMSTDGGNVWTTRRMTTTSVASTAPAVAVDGKDNVYVVYQDDIPGNNDIYFQQLPAGGNYWTLRRLTITSGESTAPGVAVDSVGNVYVVYQDNTPGNYEIYIQKSENAGSTWTTKRLTVTSGASEAPAVAVDSGDNIYVVYQDDKSGNNEIYLAVSKDGGNVWTTKRLTTSSGQSVAPAIAVDSGDSVYVSYHDNTSGNNEIYFKKSIDGGNTWTGKQLTTSSGSSTASNIAVDGAGNIHVVYQNDTSGNPDIFLMTSMNSGGTWTTKQLTSTAGTSAAPAVAAGSADILYVAYQDDTPGNSEIYFKKGVPQPKIAFVTSVSGQGNLGAWPDAGGRTGLAAGDAICKARAAAAGLKGTFVAWLSDENDDAYCRVHLLTGKKSANCGKAVLPVNAGPWLRTDGFPFSERIDLMLSPQGRIYTPMRFDEFGSPHDLSYFTGTYTDGGLDVYAATPCSNWTSSSDPSWITVGTSSRTMDNWSAGGSGNCSSSYPLLCLQTGKGPSLPRFGTQGKRAFLTSVSGNGNLGGWPQAGGKTGLLAADTICQNLAQTAGFSGTFNAWLSTGGASAKDRFEGGGPWVRVDGVKVADSVADLTDGSLFSPINVTESGTYMSNWTVWTGTAGDGVKATDRCSNWTSGSSGIHGITGAANSADAGWSWYYNMACDFTSAFLYCLEK